MTNFEVHIDLDGRTRPVGLARSNRVRGSETILFEYDRAWLQAPDRFSLEPALALTRGAFAPPAGRATFGSLGDSAPDTWGRRLMQRAERRLAERESRAVRTLSESDYLLGVADETLLLAEDIPALERALHSGWDINRQIRTSDTWYSSPVNVALSHRKDRLLNFLLDHGADLNVQYDSPLVWAITEQCPISVIEKLAAHGARIDGVNQVDWSALQAAIAAKRFDLLPELIRLGASLQADGGATLRSAVFKRQFEVVQFLIEHGYDVNIQRPDMVFPNSPSAVALAAQNGDMDTVKYLVEHGADITLTDEYGHRAYTYAVQIGHSELQEYLKDREPPEWHKETYHLQRAETHGVPQELIDFLKQPNRRIELDIGGYHPEFIEFHSLTHIRETNWKGRKLLDLLAVVDNFDATGYLTWSSRHRKLGHADYEHDQFTVLCTWKNFIANPGKWISRLPT